jgi:restriction system protein
MGHILMPSFAFRTALSEDAGVRSGFALNEADLLAHLPANSPLHDGLTRDVAMRVSAEDYAITVGDLLFALGATAKPGMGLAMDSSISRTGTKGAKGGGQD